jgi:hypothetical protein
MARDGHRDFTLDQASRLALEVIRDHQRAGASTRERVLAWMVYKLVGRIQGAGDPMEIES